MITVDDSLVGIWFVAFKGPVDVMGAVMRSAPGYKMMWRVRKHVSPEPFHKDSRTEWQQAQSTGEVSEAEAIHTMRQFMEKLSQVEPIEGTWELLRGARSDEEFTKALMAMPCVNIRKVTEEEFRAEYGEPPADLKGSP